MHVSIKLARLLMLGLAMNLAGCATDQALRAEDRAQLRDLHVQFAIPQESFSFTTPAMGLGLLGGALPLLIESAVQQARQPALQARTTPLLDQLLDLDFRTEAAGELHRPIPGLPFKITTADVSASIPGNARHAARMATQKPGDGHLLVILHYALQPDQLVLTTRSRIIFWQQAKVTFLGSAIYQGRMPPPGSDPVVSVRGQMREAVVQTLKLAALDMAPSSQGTSHGQHLLHAAGRTLAVEGKVVAREGTRELLRGNQNAMFSLDKGVAQ